MDSIKRYRLYSRRKLNSFTTLISDRLWNWASEWSIVLDRGQETVSIQAFETTREYDSCTSFLYRDETNELNSVLFISEKSIHNFSDMITSKRGFISRFGSTDGSSIANNVVLRALDELEHALFETGMSRSNLRTGDLHDTEIPECWSKPGSGALSIRLELMQVEIIFVLNEKLVTYVFKELDDNLNRSLNIVNRGELVPLTEAVKNQRVSMPLHIDSIELTVESLNKLQLSDVICLDMSLEDPLTLSIPESDYECEGFLGKYSGNLALELKNIRVKK